MWTSNLLASDGRICHWSCGGQSLDWWEAEGLLDTHRVEDGPPAAWSSCEWIRTGAAHSMNVEFNEVRVDPVIWIPLPLESKQNFDTVLSRHLDAKGGTSRVDVLSNRNDKKLARASLPDAFDCSQIKGHM